MISVDHQLRTFQNSVDFWVLNALRTDYQDFRMLVHSLPGVFPTNALESVCRLSSRRLISTVKAQYLINSAERKSFHFPDRPVSNLPVPHPLDFDWRFDLQAVNHLSKICESISDFVVCLGTPSLFEHFRRQPKTRTAFVDSNLAAIEHFGTSRFEQVVKYNCFYDPVPMVRSDVIVMDPPWYDQHSQAFLWVAAQMCNIDGKVLVSLPPLGTRDGVESERTRLFDFARQNGLIVESLHEGVLPYQTPHFEHNTLQRLGIHCPLGSWRCGTLVIFQKLLHNRVSRPLATAVEKWSELSLFGTRIRIRTDNGSRSDDPRLLPLVPGNVINSVSRNNPMRAEVDVWTSGNRVFRCDAPQELFEVGMELSERNEESPTRLRRILSCPRHRAAQNQILRIARLESNERRLLNPVQGVQFS